MFVDGVSVGVFVSVSVPVFVCAKAPKLIKATTNILSTFDTMIESNIKPEMNEKFSTMQKDVVAYIDFKIDILSQKICDMLITRKFNEEVDKRVNEKFEKLKTKGKF